ncbi:unnamed protein product [Clonostachys rhizophaga]|uniref:Uncharacterized protein n=1 Tax=Clonostachys rhizophaga TaxID=160324 RepID=A0A9N9YEX1_9HYPO|nr:unnamed protein product [Clonostachys rhizophaga]
MGLSAAKTLSLDRGYVRSQPAPPPAIRLAEFYHFSIPISFSEIGESEVASARSSAPTDADIDGYAQCLAACVPQLMNTQGPELDADEC